MSERKISYALGMSFVITVFVLVLQSNNISSLHLSSASAALSGQQSHESSSNGSVNSNNQLSNNFTQNNNNNNSRTSAPHNQTNNNNNHNTNNINNNIKPGSRLAFVYHKSGGFAPVDITISYNPITNQLSYTMNGKTTNATLSEQQLMGLAQLFTKSGFFNTTNQFYPASAGSADYFAYTLIVAYESKINAAYWTDASTDVPDSLRSLPQILEQVLQYQNQQKEQQMQTTTNNTTTL
jgi:hypothetical protein